MGEVGVKTPLNSWLTSRHLAAHGVSSRPVQTLGLMPCYPAHGGDDPKLDLLLSRKLNHHAMQITWLRRAFCCPMINHAIYIAWRGALCA